MHAAAGEAKGDRAGQLGAASAANAGSTSPRQQPTRGSQEMNVRCTTPSGTPSLKGPYGAIPFLPAIRPEPSNPDRAGQTARAGPSSDPDAAAKNCFG